MRALIHAMSSHDQERAVQAATDLSCLLKDEADPRWEEAVEAVRAELPRIAGHLVSHNGQMQGCAISILRRVPPDAATVACLLELLDDPAHVEAHDVLANALGVCEDEAWSDEVEGALTVCLLDRRSRFLAAMMLYQRHRQLCREVTLRTLAVTARCEDALAAHQALNALGSATRGPLGALATQLVDELRAQLPPERRAHLDQVLTWAHRA